MDERNHVITFSALVTNAMRLDRFLCDLLGVSRSQVKDWIAADHVFCNGASVKASQHVRYQDEFTIKRSVSVKSVPIDVALFENVIQTDQWHIPILHLDQDILVVNKPAGLVVHASDSVKDASLVDIILAAGILLIGGDRQRLGVVHRLDQFTEGVMVLATSKNGYEFLQQQFKNRLVKKSYYAVLQGCLSANEGVIDRPIGRDASVRARKSCHHFVPGTEKSAVTTYKVLNQLTNISFLDVSILTGRTHQIRVHFASLNCPVLGDFLYSKQSKKPEGYYLQSYFLQFLHPISQELLVFKLPVSDRLKKYSSNLG